VVIVLSLLPAVFSIIKAKHEGKNPRGAALGGRS
jgi:hypothetical protein